MMVLPEKNCSLFLVLKPMFLFLKNNTGKLLQFLLFIAGPLFIIDYVLTVLYMPELSGIFEQLTHFKPENQQISLTPHVFFLVLVRLSIMLMLWTALLTYIFSHKKNENTSVLSGLREDMQTKIGRIAGYMLLSIAWLLAVFMLLGMLYYVLSPFVSPLLTFLLLAYPAAYSYFGVMLGYPVRYNTSLNSVECLRSGYAMVRGKFIEVLGVVVMAAFIAALARILFSIPENIISHLSGLAPLSFKAQGAIQIVAVILYGIIFIFNDIISVIPILAIIFYYICRNTIAEPPLSATPETISEESNPDPVSEE